MASTAAYDYNVEYSIWASSSSTNKYQMVKWTVITISAYTYKK
jgi:hypothetical protein